MCDTENVMFLHCLPWISVLHRSHVFVLLCSINAYYVFVKLLFFQDPKHVSFDLK